jgi:hypothetical protein
MAIIWTIFAGMGFASIFISIYMQRR